MAEAARPEDTAAPERITELERRHAELELLFDTVRDLTSTLSTHEVIERLVDRTLIHLDSEIASVLLVEPDGFLRMMHARGLPESLVGDLRVAPGEGISGHVVASGKPLLVEDIERDPRFRRRNHERYYTSSCVSAPLLRQGRAFGVLNVNNKRDQTPYQPSDLRLLEALAGHASAAIGNARLYEEMSERARRDALTGLANHGHFWSAVETEVERAARYERVLTMVMVDVDHFKPFNDRNGHLQGDQALVAVGREIAQRTRVHDTPARYGGDEFAILLPETSLEGGSAFGEKIRQAVEALDLGLTVSVGVGCVGPGITTTSLVEAADEQLYRAKQAGRNRVEPSSVISDT